MTTKRPQTPGLAKLSILMRLAHLLPPETAHLVLALLNIRSYAPGYSSLRPRPVASRQVMGLHFANPCGIAAGLDKNGNYLRGLQSLGLGFIELGTVTPHPQAGNARPRLRRLPRQQALLNRMGFPNKGLDYMLAQLRRAPRRCPIGINLGVNRESIRNEETAQRDYLRGFSRVYAAADYVCINVSSPNTPGLRALQRPEALGQLLSPLKRAQLRLKAEHHKYTPLVVKLSPDLDTKQLKESAMVINDSGIDGVTATNTSVKHDWQEEFGGGISGPPLARRALEVLEELRHHLHRKVNIIAVGGITGAGDMHARLRAGADLAQIYTGLVYQGPALVQTLLGSLAAADLGAHQTLSGHLKASSH